MHGAARRIGITTDETDWELLRLSPVPVARSIRAQIVVMGAMSRSGLKRVFIGNTAERVLHDLPCDVLVVKPPRFKSHVTYQSRGMRVVTPPPLMLMPM